MPAGLLRFRQRCDWCGEQVPTGGTITFSLQPGNVVVGSGTVQTDPSLGSASFSFVSPADAAISGYGYGQHTGARTHSRHPAPLCKFDTQK